MMAEREDKEKCGRDVDGLLRELAVSRQWARRWKRLSTRFHGQLDDWRRGIDVIFADRDRLAAELARTLDELAPARRVLAHLSQVCRSSGKRTVTRRVGCW